MSNKKKKPQVTNITVNITNNYYGPTHENITKDSTEPLKTKIELVEKSSTTLKALIEFFEKAKPWIYKVFLIICNCF